MIAEDSSFTRNLLRSILEMDWHRVVAEAEDGKEAVANYRACRPDLVLMDILMEVNNGINATQDIIGFDKDACVVMCSIIGQEMFVKAAREAGVQGVILKPVTTEEVVAVQQQVMAAKFTMRKVVNRGKTETKRFIVA
jgi:two-component system chemotaxis response regulator CheY